MMVYERLKEKMAECRDRCVAAFHAISLKSVVFGGLHGIISSFAIVSG